MAASNLAAVIPLGLSSQPDVPSVGSGPSGIFQDADEPTATDIPEIETAPTGTEPLAVGVTAAATMTDTATETPQTPEEAATTEPTGTLVPPAEEATPTETVTPTGTATPTETASVEPSAASAMSDSEGQAFLVVLEPEKPTASPGDEVAVNWRLEGWDQKETPGELTILFTVPEGFSLVGKDADAFDAEAHTLKIQASESSGSTQWLISEDAAPPFQVTADLFLDGNHEASSGMILVAPPEEGGLELDSEAPVITLVGWAGDGKGIFMSGRAHRVSRPGLGPAASGS
jgi:hypothetical protein